MGKINNMYKIIKKDDGKLRKISPTKVAWNYITADITQDVSLAVTEAIDGYHEKELCEYNRIYYVLEGKLGLKIGDHPEELEQGDSIFIPKGTEYEMSGKFKAIVVNQPAFVASKVE